MSQNPSQIAGPEEPPASSALDQELQDAIRRTFGADALAWLDAPLAEADEDEAIEPSALNTPQTLDEVIAQIDAEVELLGDARSVFGADRALRRKAGQWAKYIVFSIAGTEYAIRMDNVFEVQRPPAITSIPNVPEWVRGITNLRGDIISIVDLRGFLGIETIGFRPHTRVIVVRANKEELMTGLVVDQVIGIRTLRVDRIGEVESPAGQQVGRYVIGRYETEKHRFDVLDIEQLLLSSEMNQFEAA
jgi:purine-binding chemotaxis protein CheW